ncbi:hypothetical protein CYMTET_26246, partial [Cymbomonas tetramitiformis]
EHALPWMEVLGACRPLDGGSVPSRPTGVTVKPIRTSTGSCSPTVGSPTAGGRSPTSFVESPAPLRVIPTFRNSSLLPVQVLQSDDEETLDFDLESIAENGSRSSALESSTKMLTEVLQLEVRLACNFSDGMAKHDVSLLELEKLVDMKLKMQSLQQTKRGKDVDVDATIQVKEEEIKEAGANLLSSLSQAESLQRNRHKHLNESLTTLVCILESIGKPVGLADNIANLHIGNAQQCEVMIAEAVQAYQTWQGNFLAAMKPAMDVTDTLLVKLYDSIQQEKEKLVSHSPLVEVGLQATGNLLSAAEALMHWLQAERAHRIFEHTRTLRRDALLSLSLLPGLPLPLLLLPNATGALASECSRGRLECAESEFERRVFFG